MNSAGNQRILIGVVLFSANEDGIWINWLAVGNEIFDCPRFGKKATLESFCMSGFGTLLLLLTQLHSIAYGWSTDIYLHANQSSAAVKFYTAKGFEKAEANIATLLPVN